MLSAIRHPPSAAGRYETAGYRARSKAAAERSLKPPLRDMSRIQSAGDITTETRVSASAEAGRAG
jgi:hypothetical protein